MIKMSKTYCNLLCLLPTKKKIYFAYFEQNSHHLCHKIYMLHLYVCIQCHNYRVKSNLNSVKLVTVIGLRAYSFTKIWIK